MVLHKLLHLNSCTFFSTWYQTPILKVSIYSQIKTTVKNTRRQSGPREVNFQGMKMMNCHTQTLRKKKKKWYTQHSRNLGHSSKPQLRIFGVKDGTTIQTKYVENVFSRFVAKNFPDLSKDMDIQLQRHLQPQTSMSGKEPPCFLSYSENATSTK